MRSACAAPALIAHHGKDLMARLGKQFTVDMEIWIVMHSDLKPVSRMRLMFDHLALNLAQFAAA
jgi:hypothetical protein